MMRRVRSMGVGAAGEQDLLPVSRSASQSPKPFGKKSKVAGKAAVGAVVVFGVYALLMLSRMGSSKVTHQTHHSDHLDFYGYEDHPGWAHDHAASDTHHHDQHHGGGWEQNWDHHHGSADTHHRSAGGHADGHHDRDWEQQQHHQRLHNSHWEDLQHHQQQHHDSHWDQQHHQQHQEQHHNSHWEEQHHQQHHADAHAHAHGDPRAAAHHHAHAATAPPPPEGRHIHDEHAAHAASHSEAGHDATEDELRPHHHADLEHAAKHGVLVEGDDEDGHYHAYYHKGHDGHEEPHYHLEYHNYAGHHAADETHHPDYRGNHMSGELHPYSHKYEHGYEPHAEDAHAHAAQALLHGSGGHGHAEQHQAHHQEQHQQQQQHAHHEQHNWREWLHDRLHHHKPADGQHGAEHDSKHNQAALDPASDLQWHLENTPLPDPTEDPAHHVNHDHEPRYLHHPDHARPQGLYTLSATESDGRRRHLSDFAGKVTLVVNVASHCSLTEQNYRGLKAVYDKYHEHGLEILAFPSNEFGGQEPGSNKEIRDFVQRHYNATWPLFEKTTVNGPHANSVYRWLKRELPVADGGGAGKGPGRDLAWNFIKILVDQRGRPVRTISQAWDQAEVENAVYDLLLAGEQEYNDWLEEQEAAQHRSGAWSRGAEAHHQQGEVRHYDNVDTQQSWQQHGLHHGADAHDAHHHGQQQHHHHQQHQPPVNHHHGDAHDAHAAVNGGKHGAWNDAGHGHGGHHDSDAAGHHDDHWGHIFNDVTDDWHKQQIADSAAAYDTAHGHFLGQGGYLQQAHADAAHQQGQEHGHQVLGDLGMKLGLGGDAHAHVQAHVDDYVRQNNGHLGGHQQQHHHQQQQYHHQQQQHHQQYHH